MANEERKREIVLAPGTYAFIQEGNSGKVKTHSGPTSLTLTQQDKPVYYNPETHGFEECSLEQAVRKNIVAPEGWYVVLINPVKDSTGKDLHPDASRASDTPPMLVGQKENVPGPVDFALYPGQEAEVRRGHHLRLNEFLRIKIYNEEKARQLWTKAVVQTTGAEADATGITKRAPEDIAVGKEYNIAGTEVSFFIPPTGVSVVPDESGIFVRAAETLEQLEYAVLVDEDGNKEYPKGPTVVFPKPTQRFLVDKQGNRKFRALEMNELQGIQVKFMTDVELTYADGTTEAFKAGDETFITGAKMPIYYPEEGHQLVKYDGKTIHYAVAIPEGDARYVMNRKTGAIRTVRGPTMLLCNPVDEIIVRRALSDSESTAMFPGADGKGSPEALTYNRWLREESAKEPTTRQGVVSEGRLQLQGTIPGGGGFGGVDEIAMNYALSGTPGTPEALYSSVANFASTSQTAGVGSAPPEPRRVLAAKMQESRQGKEQSAPAVDAAERKSTFHEPRMITFAGRHRYVPTIKLRQGYAVQVAEVDGSRKVHVGPKTILLDYGQTLDALALSTSKPKNTDNLFKTAYLNVANNKVSDYVGLETADHVRFTAKIIYNVNFEGDPAKWFSIENYVKYLCDRARSIFKGAVLKHTIEAFYANYTEILRSIIIGTSKDGEARPGLLFPENGMKVTDVEVLGVEIADQAIGSLLSNVQVDAIKTTIALNQAERKLAATLRQEEIKRSEANAQSETVKHLNTIEIEKTESGLLVILEKLQAEQAHHAEQKLVVAAEQDVIDLGKQRELARLRSEKQLAEDFAKADQARRIELIQAEVTAVVQRFQASTGTFAEAIVALQNQETAVKVAEAMSVQTMIGGKSFVDVFGDLLNQMPALKAAFDMVKKKALPVNGSTQPVA